MHLIWQVPVPAATAVRATLEVREPPQTADLYFFALQATFTEAGTDYGGGHVGLQWNRRHPGSTAANWGGYRSQQLGGSVLAGTDSILPSRPNDPNTRDYPWEPRRSYRLAIEPGSRPGWWRGSVTDLDRGETTVIRELDGGGTHLTAPLVWSEVFAPCDGPTVRVHWRDLQVAAQPERWVPVRAVRVNYQAYEAGGCTNTNAATTGSQFVQVTSMERSTANGQILSLP